MANGNFGGGVGSEADPFLIEDAFDLDAIRNRANSRFWFKLTNDINMDLPPFNGIGGWEPIPEFIGIIDGDGYSVFNLKCTPIENGRQDVGFILRAHNHINMFINIHFQDIYFESSTDPASIFTLFGLFFNNANGFREGSFSITGVVNSKVENNVSGFLATIADSSLRGITYNINSNIYIDLKNIGVSRCLLVYVADHSSTYNRSISSRLGIINLSGNFRIFKYNRNNSNFSNVFIIDSDDSDIDIGATSTNIHNHILPRENFINTNLSPASMINNSISNVYGKLFWEIPGPNTTMRPIDLSKDRIFLIGADNKLLTFKDGDFAVVADYPINEEIILEYGFDKIESLPPDKLNSLRDMSNNIELFTHFKQHPTKTPTSSVLPVEFVRRVGDSKVVSSARVVFNSHNNDISSISII